MAAAKGAAPPLKTKAARLRVSYVLGGGAHETRHCFGVSALASPAGKQQRLFSAGRDSLIFLWDLSAGAVQHVRSFTQHTDWVNDIFLAEEGRILVSASSDTTVKVWNTETAGVIKSIAKHTDYVKALAYAPKIKCFASAGLDKMIYLWDLETGASSSSVDVVAGRSPLDGHKDSIYSLAVNQSGSRLVSGSTENVIRVWDPRDGKKTMKLKGHTDNVKSVLVNEEGTLVLSGSSDGSIRLWDLGQQRCVHTYDPHTDSVWALAADEGFAKVYSGGRDKRVFVTELANSESSLLFEEKEPVVRLLLNSHEETLWSTSTSPSIHAWSLEGLQQRKKPKFASPAPERAQRESSSPSAVVSAKVAAQVALEGTALISTPRLTIGGRAGIVKHHILNNRRQVLTVDAAGRVALWDVMRGLQVQDLGDKESIDDCAKRLFEMLAIANWFSVDTRTGVCLSLFCFTGECYAEDIPNYPDATIDPDSRVNLGERILATLFKNWVRGVRAAAQSAASPPSSPDPGPSDPEKSAQKKEKKEKKEKERKEKKEKEEEEEKLKPQAPTFQLPDETQIIVSDESSGSVLLRSTIAQLSGKESPFQIPGWVADAVLHHELPPRDPIKVSFALLPFDPKEMKKGEWKDAKLGGPRLMKMKKVSAHVCKALGIKMPVISATDVAAAREWTPAEALEIVCNKQACDPNLTLAAARQFVWKSSDDLVLYYRWTDGYRRYLAHKEKGS